MFSKQTLEVLKNFSGINQSIYIKSGNKIATISPQKNIIAESIVDDNFPEDVPIFDLPKMLGILSMFPEKYNIEYYSKNLKIVGNNGQQVTIFYTDPDMFEWPKNSIDESMFEFEIEFNLKQEDLQSLIKGSNILGLPDFVVVGDGENIYIQCTDIRTDSNDISINVGKTTANFSVVFSIDNIMKLIPTNYEVKISSKSISKFYCPTYNNNKGITYWIAVEAASQFDRGKSVSKDDKFEDEDENEDDIIDEDDIPFN